MFTKFTSLFVAGAMVMAASQAQAADYFRNDGNYRPGYVGSTYNNYRSGFNGIAVGGCYGKDCTNGSCNGSCGNCSNGSCGTRPYSSSQSYNNTWSRDRWDNSRWNDWSVNTLPYRSPSYLPVYRSSTYNSPFNRNLPGYYGPTTWNSNRPFFR